MMKKLRFVLTALLVCFGMGNAFAGSIVFGELGLENGVQYSDPFDGGDFTVTFAGGGNDGKYYTTGSGIRVYGGGTMTIEAKSGTLTKIVITYDGSNKPTDASVVNIGTYDVATGTWTGDAQSVVFTRPSGGGHWRVQKIETGDDASGPEVVTEGQTPETAIDVTRALALIDELADNAKTSASYYIKGSVSKAEIGDNGISTKYGNATFTISDVTGGSLVVFRANGLENKPITNAEFLKVGDEVVVYGQLQKYVKENETTPEVAQGGYVYSINGQTKDDTPDPEASIQGGTVDSPLTVSQALQYIGEFPDGFTTTKQYYVSGTVDEVTEISTANGNATFVMRGETGAPLTVYRVKGLENKNITSEDYLKADDAVVVLAKLQKYVKDEEVKPELSSGYIYSLNGETQEQTAPVELVGDGSEDNPYTVGDLRQMSENDYPAEKAWVKGVIVGSAKSGSALNADENVASNIAIAEDAASAEFVPVELKNNTDARAMLNVLDNPDNIGKDVKLFGEIMKYFGVTGVKNLESFEIDGVITAIQTVEAAEAAAPLYNVAGQRVVRAQKGLYIQNGRKYIVK